MNPLLAFIPHLGPMEITLLLLLAVLLFGKRLPELGRSLGRAIVEFKRGYHGLEDEVNGPVR